MTYKYFSQNDKILPVRQALVPLNNIEYSYGFGVYETVRVAKGAARFLDEHCHRLMASAKLIGLEHPFDKTTVQAAASRLIEANQVDTCNLKVLLIGGPTKDKAILNILCLNPLFPDRKLYKDGAACITYDHERPFPSAKTLNMLPSYLAYREARVAGAYEALFVNRQGCLTEGTRTNFLAVKNKTLFSPPEKDILPGVTRKHVIEVAEHSGFKVVERDIKLADIADYDGACLTGTLVKIMPVRTIGKHVWPEVPAAWRELMAAYDRQY